MTKYEEILQHAVEAIDRKFGRDYSRKNPRVLTALLHSVSVFDEIKSGDAKIAALTKPSY